MGPICTRLEHAAHPLADSIITQVFPIPQTIFTLWSHLVRIRSQSPLKLNVFRLQQLVFNLQGLERLGQAFHGSLMSSTSCLGANQPQSSKGLYRFSRIQTADMFASLEPSSVCAR